MLTEKDYCDYDTCVALKELGYKGEGHYTYKIGCQKILFQPPILTVRTASALGHILAIHLYSAQKWLREEKEIEVVVLSVGMIGAPYYFQVYTEDYVATDDKNYDSYEEALSEGIKEAIKLLKEKEDE